LKSKTFNQTLLTDVVMIFANSLSYHGIFCYKVSIFLEVF